LREFPGIFPNPEEDLVVNNPYYSSQVYSRTNPVDGRLEVICVLLKYPEDSAEPQLFKVLSGWQDVPPEISEVITKLGPGSLRVKEPKSKWPRRSAR
jgi:hypothetical protein